MLYAFTWIIVFVLLALWSLAAWGLHSVGLWTVSNAPPLLTGLGPVVDGLLQATPTLASGLTVATWVVWGIGSAALLSMGALAHLLIAMWRRRGEGYGPTRVLSAG
jgi:hypothetical protein